MNDKTELMSKIAKMYYLHGVSQKDIAAQLGFSRGYVCQLLERARETGIVEIRVHESEHKQTDLERKICELFDLKKAIFRSSAIGTSPVDEHVVQEDIFREACRYVSSVIKNNMVVAFSWGKTVYNISCMMERQTSVKNIAAVPLCGGTSDLEHKTYATEISMNIAQAYNGTPLYIPLPAILDTAEIKNMVSSDYNIANILKKGKYADIALFTVGGYMERNSIYLGGYITASMVQLLNEQNAVGDLCAHFINEYGDICDEELDRRTVSIDLQDFRRIPNKICVVSDRRKAKALLGVLRKGYVDVLISDEETALSALRLV